MKLNQKVGFVIACLLLAYALIGATIRVHINANELATLSTAMGNDVRQLKADVRELKDALAQERRLREHQDARIEMHLCKKGQQVYELVRVLYGWRQQEMSRGWGKWEACWTINDG